MKLPENDMLEKLRAFVAHFGAVVDGGATHLAHVPTALWNDLKSFFTNDVDPDVHAVLTSAESSVQRGSETAVQLAAGDLAKLHDIIAPTEPVPLAPATVSEIPVLTETVQPKRAPATPIPPADSALLV